mmetsp:Transcript_42624/g.99903  ORF Transcript_42624/g.99903 Transcript_42624/m.99903 type:complete len:210 (-) Transcript_42624:342-971(-)
MPLPKYLQLVSKQDINWGRVTRPEACRAALRLEARAIRAATPGGDKLGARDGALLLWDDAEAMDSLAWALERDSCDSLAGMGLRWGTHGESRSFEVIQPCSELTCGLVYPGGVRAVLVISGAVTLEPPNFKAMGAAAATEWGKTFGGIPGVIVKHFLASRWGEQNRGGGCYFFESVAAAEEYLGSQLWAGVFAALPWRDVTYEMYAVVA